MIGRLITLLGLGTMAVNSSCSRPSSTFGSRPFISSDGSRIVFSASPRGQSDLYELQIQNSKLKKLTNIGIDAFNPAYSPDGKLIVYGALVKKKGQIFVMNADGTGTRRITNSSYYDSLPSFSPDGSRIIFSRRHRLRPYSMGGSVWDDGDLYSIKADGSGERRLTHANSYLGTSPPSLSPDGKVVIFSAENGSTETDIFVLDLQKPSKPKVLITSQRYDSDPSFSPDGKKIVFISDRAIPYDYEIWIANSNGTEPKQVTRNKSYNSDPMFFPDGKSILFLSDPERDIEFVLMRVDVNGKNLRELANNRIFRNP